HLSPRLQPLSSLKFFNGLLVPLCSFDLLVFVLSKLLLGWSDDVNDSVSSLSSRGALYTAPPIFMPVAAPV
ncbi:MAG: hypothetical protein ABSF34_22475, partial [Verrucomicrobiota bacterium]